MDLKQSAGQARELWLGYDGLLVPFSAISALLVYQTAWDRRLVQAYGRVPGDVQAVVLLHDGRMLPARRSLADLHARWGAWQAQQSGSARETDRDHEAPDPADDGP